MERTRSTGSQRVSVLLPVLNEERHIRACLESLLGQDHVPFEILIAEGGSTDATTEIIASIAATHSAVRIVPNPERLQSYGLNNLLRLTRGDVVVRADAHTTYAPDYLSRCLEALAESGADLVGGPMVPAGTDPWERAIAAAMTSPLAVGGASHRRLRPAGESDTVYLGAATTATLRRHGGYRHLPSGVGEDADLAYRIRQAGGRVWLDPAIRSTYRPRESLGALWRQFRLYGSGKAEMLHVNGQFPSWRPLLPLALVVGVLIGLVAGVTGWSWLPLVAVAVGWATALVTAAVRSPHPVRTAGAVAVMHCAYAVGLSAGLLRRRSTVAAMRGADPSADATAEDLHRDPEHG